MSFVYFPEFATFVNFIRSRSFIRFGRVFPLEFSNRFFGLDEQGQRRSEGVKVFRSQSQLVASISMEARRKWVNLAFRIRWTRCRCFS